MTTLPLDIARCSGRFDLKADGEWCPERDTCQRYLAFHEWDRAACVVSYAHTPVVMADNPCRIKIEVTE